MIKITSVITCALILSSCAIFRPTPGKEKEAEPGLRASRPVIEALEKFRLQQNKYPSKLTDLAPSYLENIDSQFGYQPDAKSYSLGFTYTGRGLSYCEYRPETNWNCKTKY